MENWGLITYREAALLYEDRVTARINKQRVATVVAHELAHQVRIFFFSGFQEMIRHKMID